MSLLFIRIFFILISVLTGHYIGEGYDYALIGSIAGFVFAMGLILLEISVRRISLRGLSSAVFGLIFGIIMAKLLTDVFSLLPLTSAAIASFRVISTVIFGYLGMVMALRGRDEFNVIIPYVKFSRQDQREELVLMDTSAIIDGRILDICKTKFLEGRLVIPRFVLKELQTIADSTDPLKRQRGRRGLEVLNAIQKDTNIAVKIHEQDFPGIADVDAKLVKLGKLLNAKVFTTDYNLNRIAELQGVLVMNINELANALKPVVLPGEIFDTKVIKEGKEHNQGIGYLDDGTMVVVEEGRKLLGQQVKVSVTSVLQTQAGRMIFTKITKSRKHDEKKGLIK